MLVKVCWFVQFWHKFVKRNKCVCVYSYYLENNCVRFWSRYIDFTSELYLDINGWVDVSLFFFSFFKFADWVSTKHYSVSIIAIPWQPVDGEIIAFGCSSNQPADNRGGMSCLGSHHGSGVSWDKSVITSITVDPASIPSTVHLYWHIHYKSIWTFPNKCRLRTSSQIILSAMSSVDEFIVV